MISPTRIPLPDSFGITSDGMPDLVAELLAAQQSLTAVERFSAQHQAGLHGGTDTESLLENKNFYRDLIPLRAPEAGEQYAFEVDLDRCTGCKACVTACHNLNGLDDDETWRSVGVLHNAQPDAHLLSAMADTLKPVQQHITTACHHCADPGCAQGCPTLAYEKDPATGIVRHLDDQCFGCQYCILKCPYDVPQYSAKRGIVRKCDLCIGRLRAGEAPACAQACPTQAIRVTLVGTAAVCAAPAEHFDLTGAPDPSRVMPTTRYVTTRGLPDGMVAVDAAQVKPEHAHLPLVLMLVASQAAAGYWILLAVNALIGFLSGSSFTASGFTTFSTLDLRTLPWPELLGVAGVHVALGLSMLHLGRPLLAWKAVLGWRRSWLSREVIAFSALAASTVLYTAFSLAAWFLGGDREASGFSWALGIARAGLGGGVIVSSAAAIYASAMVYRDTPRALWATRDTLWKFALTSAVVGLPAWLLITQLSVMMGLTTVSALSGATLAQCILAALPVCVIAKLALEMNVFAHRADGARGDFNPLYKAAALMDGVLRPVWLARVILALGGGVFLPLTLLLAHAEDTVTIWPLVAACTAAVLIGEFLERFLFFTTAIAPRMPGGRK
jgi:Fe-S-cluster-containing dehydrogenase component/DMSO reductase anchor subunit